MKKEEEKFTMAELEEQLKAKQADREKRMQRFAELIGEAEKETNCTLQVDLNSPLNNIKIVVISKI
jgi:D-serine dehydratase